MKRAITIDVDDAMDEKGTVNPKRVLDQVREQLKDVEWDEPTLELMTAPLLRTARVHQ